MAKNMALLESGVVTNLLWCSDGEPETQVLIDCGELGVAIGDSYSDGAFYRDGEKLLTAYERLEMQTAELLGTMAAMVEEVYESDLTVFESGGDGL